MKMENVNTKTKFRAIIRSGIAVYLAFNVIGCSFGVEIGYHGLTGVSNTTASALANTNAKKIQKEKDY